MHPLLALGAVSAIGVVAMALSRNVRLAAVAGFRDGVSGQLGA